MPSSEIPNDPGEISLRRWRVTEIEAPDGVRSRHVWGHDVTHNQGRASSAIIEFNKDTMTATTRSGKLYKLVGLPGNSRIGRSAWSKWCRDNGIVSDRDVTDDYLNVNQVSTVGFNKITKSLSN
jgi:hypothetical protein